MSILSFCLPLTAVMYAMMVCKCSSKVLGGIHSTLPLEGGTFVSGDPLKLRTEARWLVGFVRFTLGVAKCKQVDTHNS